MSIPYAKAFPATAIVFVCWLLLALAAPAAHAAPMSVYDVFGQFGSGNGEFQTAGGVAFDEGAGDAYVQDVGGNRIQRFDGDGSYLSQLGEAGAGDGQFNFNFAQSQIAVAPDGSVYVADTGNNRVQKFDSSGAYLLQIGAPGGVAGSGDGELSGPQGVAVAPDGSVYVADTGNDRVQKFDSSGAYLSQFGSSGSSDGQFTGPGRVAVDSTGAVYVMEQFNRVQKFDSTGAFVTVFAAAQLTFSPHELAVDQGNDHVFVAQFSSDFSSLQVLELDSLAGPVETHQAVGFATGLVVDSPSARLYVADGFANRVAILDEITEPTAAIEPVTDVTSDSATLNGTVNPNGSPTGYRFEYSTDGVDWTLVPDSDADVGAGTVDVPVSQPLSGIEPNTEYRVRLVATKPFHASVVSAETTFTTDEIPPSVTAPGAAVLSDTSVRLRGRIDPNNSATAYRFEYGPDTGYGSTIPIPDGDAGSGGSPTLVSALVSDLEPETDYHFRLVAVNGAGTTNGPDATFTTRSLPQPPTGRGYEMVSPPDKNGSEASFRFVFDQAAVSGDAIAWISTAAFGDAQGAVLNSPYLSRRGPDGWSTKSLAPPIAATSVNTPFVIYGYSPDLRHMFFSHKDPPLAAHAVAGLRNLWRRDEPDGTFGLLSDFQGPAPPPGAATIDSKYVSSTADAGRVVFTSPFQLTPDAVPFVDNFTHTYEWIASTGEVRDVGVLPDGTHVHATAGDSGTPTRALDALSADGSRIFFTSGLRLYVRENGSSTEHVSASQATAPDPAGSRDAAFWAASEDGRWAFFTSCEKLTDDSTAVSSISGQRCDHLPDGVSHRNDLYRYDVDSDELVDLTTADPGGGGVLGVVGASDSGDRLFFVATGVLADGAAAGEPNLYAWQTDGSPDGSVLFVATLDEDDHTTWGRTTTGGGLPDSNGATARSSSKHSDARTTPDGRFLAFVSAGDLTGHPTAGHAQVYLFDADAPSSQGLECASCDPGGQPSTAAADIAPWSAREGAQGLDTYMPRNLSADGRRLVFETRQALVPQDGNGKVDVYLYDDGRPHLVSSGRSDADSQFVDASPSGDDVFFLTSESLVGWDVDGDRYDVYDARVGGGFPEPVTPDPPCTPGQCQGLPDDPPTLRDSGAPAQGSGDLAPARRGAFTIARVSAGQRARLARSGRLRLTVRVTTRGRVSVTARARIGRRAVTVGRASKTARAAGRVRLMLRLSPRARRQLTRRGALPVSLSVAFSNARERKALRLSLKLSKRGAAGAVTSRRAAVSLATASGR